MRFIIPILPLVALFSCGPGAVSETDRVNSDTLPRLYYPKPIAVLNCSRVLSEALDSLTLDSSSNSLTFRLNLHLDSFPFPVLTDTNHTDFECRFNAEILREDGSKIPCATGLYWRSGHAYPIGKDDTWGVFERNMQMKTSFIDMQEFTSFYFEVPLLAFAQLPEGYNKLRIRFWQEDWQYTMYRPATEANGGWETKDTIIAQPMMECTASFTLYRKPVRSTQLTCERIEVNMDSTTWDYGDESDPDVYWQLWNKPRNFIVRSSIFENSPEVNEPSFLELFYYTPEDSVFLEVMDRDWDTEDDVIGKYATTVAAILKDTGMTLKFDSVNVFILHR